jgi:uncharacterized protein YwgA
MIAVAQQSNNKVATELLVPYLIYKFSTGMKPCIEHYDDRILWQKIGYLAQELGLPLNEYRFTWYKRGPYSPAYTSVLYDIHNNFNELERNQEVYSLTARSEKQLEPLRNMVEQQPSNYPISMWMELLASIHFIGKQTISKTQVFSKLVKEKPVFNDPAMFNHAWQVLKTENVC